MREQFPAASAASVILWALSFAVAEYVLWRSRRAPALASAVTPMFAWVALDGLRQAGVLPPIPDVLAFCALPACWMALLAPGLQRCVECGGVGVTSSANAERHMRRSNIGDLGKCEEIGERHPRILLRLTPLVACLAYAAVLLALRHEPAVRAHWTGALQLPRLVAFGWALAVALRWRGRIGARGHLARGDGSRGSSPGGSRLAHPRAYLMAYRHALPPSTAIGIVMALGGGICAAGGLWADWYDVRIVAAVAWLLSAAIAWRAR